MANPPNYPCRLVVACNGGPISLEQSLMFAPLNAHFFPRVNDPSWDIGGFQDCANGPCKDADMVLFCGESIYFTREGWMKRMVAASEKHGPGFYGFFGSYNVRAHLQTSAFFCPPSMLKLWPGRPNGRAQRMAWEHGPNALWRRAERMGFPVKLVTWSGEWEPRMWRYPKNGLWKGDQSDLVLRNNHALGWENASETTKRAWTVKADSFFQ